MSDRAPDEAGDSQAEPQFPLRVQATIDLLAEVRARRIGEGLSR